MKIENCAKCGTKPYVALNRVSQSLGSGNGYHKPRHDFYVSCPKCGCAGEWVRSDRPKAIRLWNKKQKELRKVDTATN